MTFFLLFQIPGKSQNFVKNTLESLAFAVSVQILSEFFEKIQSFFEIKLKMAIFGLFRPFLVDRKRQNFSRNTLESSTFEFSGQIFKIFSRNFF